MATYKIRPNGFGKVKLSVFFAGASVRRMNWSLTSQEEAFDLVSEYFSDAVKSDR